MKLGRENRAGFVTLELGVALLLLSVVVMLGLRLLALEVQLGIAGRQSWEMAASMEAVWLDWRRHGGQLALAVRKSGGEWDVLGFPGEDWLPLMKAGEREEDAGYLWRRRLVAAGGRTVWQTDFMNRQTGQWEWRETILHHVNPYGIGDENP